MNIPVVRIPGNYSEKLRTNKPISLYKPAKPGQFRGAPTGVTIPPLNTDIRFGNVLPISKPQKVFRAEALPEKWDWVNIYPKDDKCTIERKKNITPVLDQYKCGSCWAVSTASAMSDTFVAAGYPNPQCSSTFALACYPQGACEGGNPGQLVLDVQQNGITGNSCVDYSFCAQKTGGDCSTVPSCGCYNSDGKHNFYFVTNPKLIVVTDDANENANAVAAIKSHILNAGPIVGGFHVYANFPGGNYAKTNGVYIEAVDYSTVEEKYIDMSFAEPEGGHAVVIVGWGKEKNVKVAPNTVVDVPYWLVRNSWSEKWGDKGYFKMAMYPFNKYSQFEHATIISDNVGDALGGGMILFDSGKIEPANNLNKINNPPKNLLNDPAFYDADVNMVKNECKRSGVEGSKNKLNIGLIIGLILVILLVIVLIVFLARKK
jgi:hypothetical protein